MREWIDWYDSDHPIYVSARHRDVHFRSLATDILQLLHGPDATVLDFSCGEALHANLVADKAERVILAEPAPGVRKRLEARFAANPKIEVRSLAQLTELPKQSVDLAVMHSVIQYMTPAELDAALTLIRLLLKPGGLFVLGDVVAPGTPAATDAVALLRFGAANGFFLAAMHGLVRTVLSDYWRLRSTIGLARYDETAITARLAAHGFVATRAPRNLGHNQARMTFLCKPC
ncbi:MAG: class I SAM-dependent methyltransferase [Xanthobacteraceae bacterium]|nr:class I SAM-dependent methyltransferase [Xanthobacteraceae bacterium]